MTQVNFSLNGIPGTLWEIRRQENIHPYLGLRQAILIIDDKEKTLREGYLAQKKARLSIKQQKKDFFVSNLTEDELEIRLDEIDIAEHNIKMFDQLILDAEMELQIAKEERQRIEDCNPDMAHGTYKELQYKYANEAFRCKLTKSLVVAIYSSFKIIPEGAAELVYDAGCLSPAERKEFDASTVQQLTQFLPQLAIVPQSIETNGELNGFVAN